MAKGIGNNEFPKMEKDSTPDMIDSMLKAKLIMEKASRSEMIDSMLKAKLIIDLQKMIIDEDKKMIEKLLAALKETRDWVCPDCGRNIFEKP